MLLYCVFSLKKNGYYKEYSFFSGDILLRKRTYVHICAHTYIYKLYIHVYYPLSIFCDLYAYIYPNYICINIYIYIRIVYTWCTWWEVDVRRWGEGSFFNIRGYVVIFYFLFLFSPPLPPFPFLFFLNRVFKSFVTCDNTCSVYRIFKIVRCIFFIREMFESTNNL